MLQTTGDCLFSGSLAAAGWFHVFWHHWILAPLFYHYSTESSVKQLRFCEVSWILIVHSSPQDSREQLAISTSRKWGHLSSAQPDTGTQQGTLWGSSGKGLQCHGGGFVWQGVCFKQFTGIMGKKRTWSVLLSEHIMWGPWDQTHHNADSQLCHLFREKKK